VNIDQITEELRNEDLSPPDLAKRRAKPDPRFEEAGCVSPII
jgi:hypothetical protein